MQVLHTRYMGLQSSGQHVGWQPIKGLDSQSGGLIYMRTVPCFLLLNHNALPPKMKQCQGAKQQISAFFSVPTTCESHDNEGSLQITAQCSTGKWMWLRNPKSYPETRAGDRCHSQSPHYIYIHVLACGQHLSHWY